MESIPLGPCLDVYTFLIPFPCSSIFDILDSQKCYCQNIRLKKKLFDEISMERLQKLNGRIDLSGLQETDSEIICQILKALAKFRSVEVRNVMQVADLDENYIRELVDKINYRTASGQLVPALQIASIRRVLPTIYFSYECGQDL